jgi:Ca2+-binding EF-hand superfamily protein
MTSRILASLLATALLAPGAVLANDHDMSAKFAMMDKDSDGKITDDEHEDFHEKHFKMMDKDSNGSVTMEEMRMAKEMHKGK